MIPVGRNQMGSPSVSKSRFDAALSPLHSPVLSHALICGMKPVLIVLVFAISTGFFAPKASAQSITFQVGVSNDATISYVDYGKVTNNMPYAGEIDIAVSQYGGLNYSPAVSVVTFCIQLNTDIYIGNTYSSFNQVTLANDPLLSSTIAMRDLTTLYYLYFKGPNSSAWNSTTAAAFQIDCWKITEDPGNYNLTGTTGNFYLTSSGTEVSLAQQWLNAVSGTSVSSGGDNQPFVLYDPNYQNLLFTQSDEKKLIPFEVHAWPGAVVLAGVAFLRIRRQFFAWKGKWGAEVFS